MNVGIVGLGLIGGSLARAYKEAGHTVFAKDIDRSILDFAMLSGVVDAELSESAIAQCELLLVVLYPKAAQDFLLETAGSISSKTTVIDCCGTKREICALGFELAAKHGFTFVGGHPMAGTEQSGFKHSKANMFKGATMIIVPKASDDIHFLDRIKQLLAPAGFARLSVTTAEKHDAMIAFTSQMAHLASNAFIKSPTALEHKGFSAGSYKDLTRVAWLNETMWAELFLENKEHLLRELDVYVSSLSAYKTALEADDFAALSALLYEGKRIKEEVDRR